MAKSTEHNESPRFCGVSSGSSVCKCYIFEAICINAITMFPEMHTLNLRLATPLATPQQL